MLYYVGQLNCQFYLIRCIGIISLSLFVYGHEPDPKEKVRILIWKPEWEPSDPCLTHIPKKSVYLNFKPKE